MSVINGKTRICGVMANPVEHTLSPVLHNFLAQEMGINSVYVPFKVEEDQMEQAIKGAFGLNLLGLNVTVPHKQHVIPYLVEVDSVAMEVGAVNTLVRQEHGFKGYNTDVSGFGRALEEADITMEGEEVILIGAGGAAKAIAYLLGNSKVKKVYLLNRTIQKAEELAGFMNERFGQGVFLPKLLSEYSDIPDGSYVAIQTTSVGMHPNVNQVPIEDLDFYKKIHMGIDIIYTPAQTRFMELVEGAGGRNMNGLSMLLYQGIIAFEHWNQCRIPASVSKQAYETLRKALSGHE